MTTVAKIIQEAEDQIQELIQIPVHLELVVGTEDRFRIIVDVVSEVTGVSVERMKFKSREQDLVEARGVVAYIANVHYGYTTVSIAKFFNMNHTSIISIVNRVKGLIEVKDYQILRKVNHSIAKITTLFL